MRRSLAALAAVLCLSACGNEPVEPDPTEAPTSTEATSAEATTAAATDELTVGGAAALSVTADDTSYVYDVTAIRAEQVDGSDHVLADVTITVTDGQIDFLAGWTPLITPVLESGGAEYEQSTYEIPGMFEGAIAAGETVSGTVGFEAPPGAADAGVYRIELLSLSGPAVHEWTY